MNIRQLRDLVIKFIGLLCLLNGIALLPGLAPALVTLWQGYVSVNPFVLLTLLMLPLYFGLAAVLLFKSHVVAGPLWSKQEEDSSGAGFAISLESCIALIGVYLISKTVHDGASHLMLFYTQPGGPTRFDFFPDVVTLAAALMCIIRSRTIADCIRKYAK